MTARIPSFADATPAQCNLRAIHGGKGASGGRWGPARRGGGVLAVALAFLVALPGPATAYSVTTGGFTSGAEEVFLSFDPATTEIVGSAVRLLTNATITAASVVVEGRSGVANTTSMETSSTDFASYRLAQNISISSGTLTLSTGRANITLDASNSFGNAALSGTVVAPNGLQLNGTTSGSFVSGNLTAPPTGWGTLYVEANTSLGGTVAFSLLRPDGTVLASNVPIGGPINVDSIANPRLRVRGLLSAASSNATPTVSLAVIGQVAGDTLLPGAVQRVQNSFVESNGSLTLRPNLASFSRFTANPLLTTQASSYRSVHVLEGTFVQENGTWHAFTSVNTAVQISGLAIAHAVSTDFSNWTWDAQPVLVRNTTSWDSVAVSTPWIVANPGGSPKYFMYYSGWTTSTRFVSGLAFSDDLYNWSKYSGNPVLTYSSSGWDTWNSGNPRVLYENGSWKMWYAGTSTTTGGGNSMGYATSSDGMNWTKSSNNPVLPRNQTSGAIDRDDLQLKSVRVVGGQYHALFACIPTGGSYHACYANSTDGISWTKHPAYILNGSGGSNWDAVHVQPYDYVVVNNQTYLSYIGGSTSNWASAQVGLALADPAGGSTTSQVDLGSRPPSALVSVGILGDFPNGSSATASIRSSSDGQSWTNFEVLGPAGLVQTTPAARYVEWRVSMSGSNAGLPMYAGLRMEYESPFAHGRYESSTFTSSSQIASAAVVTTPEAPNGATVVIEISQDNGTTWTRADNGTLVTFSVPGKEFVYALELECGLGARPTIDRVDLTFVQTGQPENVTVRLGYNSTPFLDVAGTFAGAYNVTMDPDDLNAIISQALSSTPGATYVDVPFVVTSTHFGSVVLREPRLTMELKNPLSVTFTPPGTAAAIDENTSIDFGVSYTVYPPSVKVNSSWLLNGVPLTAWDDQLQFTFAADYQSAGTFLVRAQVENGDFFFNHSWVLTVRNSNRVPAFTYLSPATPLQVSHAATTRFDGLASDPDLENLSYTWRLNGIAIASGTTSVNVSGLPLGLNSVTLEVRDPYSMITHTWVVNATNAPPSIVDTEPAPNISISHTGNIFFRVVAVDGDFEALSYTWFLDGALVPTLGNESEYRRGNFAVGAHAMRVVVGDRYSSVNHSWVFNATNDAPAIVASFPSAVDFNLSHAAALNFSIGTYDGDGDVLAVVWSLDGVFEVANVLEIQVARPTLGPHVVRVEVRDPYAFVEHVWSFNSTNAAPEVLSVIPGAELSASQVNVTRLSVYATDADGDALSYAWTVDNEPIGADEEFLYVGPLVLGLHTVQVRVTDQMVSVTAEFTLRSVNLPPQLMRSDPQAAFAMSHTATRTVRVEVIDWEQDILTYRWILDGVELPARANTTDLGPLPVGPHALVLEVRDGTNVLRRTYDISVENSPPAILDPFPAPGRVDAVAFTNVTFSARVVDPDNDPVTTVWFVDNVPTNHSVAQAVLRWTETGSHVVTLQASSGGHVASISWDVQVTATNAAPAIASASPAGGTASAFVGGSVAFVADVADDGALPLTVEWLLDGRVVAQGTGYIFVPDASQVGAHNITVRASDGQFTAERSWQVDVAGSGPLLVAGVDPAIVVFAAISAASAAVALLMTFRARRPPAP